MPRILVTGVTGFAGSHLVDYMLARGGCDIVGIQPWRSRTENIEHFADKITMLECDLRDATSTLDTLDKVRPDWNFHLAAQSFVPSSWSSPTESLTTNVLAQVIEPHLRSAGIPGGDGSIGTASHGAIVDHLCAADVWLLLRERHPMNEAASPGKFGEYTLSGLPIVMTEGIGDFSGQIQGHPMACVLPGLDDAALIRKRVQSFCSREFTYDDRLEFSRWAGEQFAIETVIPALADLYRSV